MADFRRWFFVLAVLALTAGLASAQVGTAGTTQAGALSCTANGASIPQLRVEGFTELVGDILISCTGGPAYASGSLIPTTNITVYVTPSYSITSRLFANSGNTGISEVALLIDEPGSGLTTGAAGYGPQAPQTLCLASSNPTGCPTYVYDDGVYEVASGSPTSSTNAANVYQGFLGAVGSNTVTFYGVPVLPPVTTGVQRIFRITNIRYPVTQLGNQTQILASVSTSPSTVLPLTQAGFPIGVVISPGLIASVGSAATFQQCATPNPSPALSSILSFKEGFATAFKTRVVPLSNIQYAAEGQNLTTQNIPGGLYGGFASNSESGLILGGSAPPDTGSSNGTTFTAGLADFGTRLKAVFTNIPAGITLYVSTASITSSGGVDSLSAPLASAGTATLTSSLALLVSTGTGEAASDGTAFTPIAGTSFDPAGGTVPVIPLAPNSSGVATAIWEVTNSEPSAVETFKFGVYVSYTANPGAITTANPYGLPAVTTGLNAPVNNVSLSFAPEPSQGAFSAAAGPVPSTDIIPRFTILNPAGGQWVNVILCQTTLLYPFVTANPAATGLGQGFDTGIAVANTSMDPFGALGLPTNPPSSRGNPAGTLAETGSCTLFPYGVTLTSAGAQSAAPAVVKGCDTISNPVPGQNCFPVVAPGSVQTVLTSVVFPNFQGYVIAVCNFQYAHGYAAVTDLGLRGLFSSYLALELSTNCITSDASTSGGICTFGRGVSIEQLVH
jgi:hypothetical protein